MPSIYDVIAKADPATTAIGGGAAGYLEYPAVTVMGDLPHTPPRFDGFFRLASVGCRCGFCKRCAVPAGVKLRRRLERRLGAFRCPFTVTLTVDPALFPGGPQEAFAYLKRNRCVARFVKSLKALSDAGTAGADGRPLVRLHSTAFFAALEYQGADRGGWPHFHLVLDASFVSHDVMKAEWGRFRPRLAAPAQGNRPAFGSVYFTKDAAASRGSAEKAAKYATKYIVKQADDVPRWVLDLRRVRRYSTSHGFWGDTEPRPPRPEPPECCGKCGEFREECACPKRTIRDRLRDCGQSTALLWVTPKLDLSTGELSEVVRHLKTLPCELYRWLSPWMDPEARSHPYRHDVPRDDWPKLSRAIRDAFFEHRRDFTDADLATIAAFGKSSVADTTPVFWEPRYRWEWNGGRFQQTRLQIV